MHKNWRRKAFLPIAIIAATTSGLSVLISGAVFNDSETSAANTLSSGTIDITASPASAVLTMSNMMPGDSVVAPLSLSNAGSGDLRYSVTTAATNTDGKSLASALQATVKTGVTTCTVAGFSGSGTVVTGPVALSSLTVGNPAQGAQAGDRNIASGGTETLCLQATLPLSAANALQGATTTATFTISAEQTKNN